MATDAVESLLFGRPHLLHIRRGRVKGEDVCEAFGQTSGGHYLVVFFIHETGAALPISARDMTEQRDITMSNREDRGEIPEEFDSEEEAGRFWDTHDSSEYLDQMEPVEADVRLDRRHFEIEVDAEVLQEPRNRARTEHVTASRLANELLCRGLSLH